MLQLKIKKTLFFIVYLVLKNEETVGYLRLIYCYCFCAEIAIVYGQNPNQKMQYRDDGWKNAKTLRSRDATWSRFTGVDIKDLVVSKPIAQSHSGTLYRGKWQNNDIVARVLNVAEVTARISRDFQTEFPALRLAYLKDLAL